jgi:hypothetical protein
MTLRVEATDEPSQLSLRSRGGSLEGWHLARAHFARASEEPPFERIRKIISRPSRKVQDSMDIGNSSSA